MLGKENTGEQVADDQMDVDASSTNSATSEQRYEDRLSNEFQHRLSCESQENPGPSSASSGSVRHSALNDNESIANAASDEVMGKAAFFVKTFVRKFEKKISKCSEEVEPDSKIKKIGKIADKCTSILNDSIPPGIWKPVFKETSKRIGSLTAEKHKRREKKFYATVVPFKDKQREILVKASLEVFQKFEQQFTQVVDVYPPSWERGIWKLAIDAVSRAKNYILNSNKIEEFSANLITKGIIFGESKNSFPISYSKCQMEDEEFNEALSTSGLYEEVGVKRINEHNTKKYYRLKEHDNTEKYGYRLPFDYESEEWCEIGDYVEVNCLPEEEYEYILDNKKKKKLADSVLEKINREDPVKKEDTQKIKEDTQEIKELCKEIKNNQKDKSTRSFSFNLGQLPRSFIKRKTMLNELTTKLFSENQEVEMSRKVLISGEHGIGKSELARSYAHSKESDGSNVWTKAVWIDTRTHDTFLNSFCSLAEELKISTQNAAYHNVVRDREIKSIVKDVYKKFQDEKTLFVFDGASDYEKIEKFLPSSFSDLFFGKEKPYILITSRHKDWEERMEKVELDKGFSLEEGIKFVRETLKIQDRSQDECMVSFIKALNYLPLALAQATAHINKIAQKKPNISGYLECYKKAIKESNPDLLIALGISEELFIPLKGNFDKMEKEGNIVQQLQNVYTAMIYLNLNHIDIEKFSFQKKSEKGKQQVLDTLNPLNKISVAELKESIAKVHKKPIIAKKEGTEKETLREIMISLVNSGITNVSHIIFIWSHISKYKELVSEFIDLIYDNGYSILHLLSANDSKEVVKLILEKVDLSKLSESINTADKMGFAPLDYASMRGSLDMVKYLIEKGADFKRDNCDFIPLHCAALCGQLEIVKYFIDNKCFELDELDRMGNTSLHYAVIHCHLCIVEYLVEKGADVNLQDKKGLSSLHFAVLNGHLDIVKCLVEKGASVNLRDKKLASSLHYAAESGHLNSVKYLIEKGTDVNLQDEDYMSSLHYAAKNGHLNVTEYLVERRTNVNLRNEDGMNPLHIAAQYDYLGIVKYLVERGADVTLQDEDGMSPLHIAAKNGHLNVTEYLVERRTNVNLRNEDGMSPLHIAAQYDYLGIVKYLVERGADVTLQDEDGLSPLHFAAQNGHLDIVKYLIERGISVNLQNKDYMNPLHIAAENGHLDIVKYFVEGVCDVNLQDKDGMGLLHFAAQNGHLDIVKYLIERGVSVSLQNEDGTNPLHFAAENGHLDIAEYFVERGVDVNSKDKDGMRPLHYATKNGRLDVAKYLVEKEADIHLQDEDGMSSLHFAAMCGRLDIVKYLVKAGASVNLQDKDGMSPLHYATKNGHLDVTSYLTMQVATMNLKYKDSFAIYNQNIKVQSLASDLKVPSHKRRHKTSSESKKRRLENMSVISEEGSSNIQLLQGNISDISMQYEDLDHRMQGDICTEEKVNSQLENSDSQQMVNSRYLLCVQ